MPTRPNYRRDRLERDRAARARTDEKQKKRDEKSAKRKAESQRGRLWDSAFRLLLSVFD